MYWSRHRDSLALGTQERRAKVLYSMSKCFRATSIGLLNMMNGSKAANPFAMLLVSPTRFRTSLMRNCTYCWLSLTKAAFTVPEVACMAGRSDFFPKWMPSARALLAIPTRLDNLSLTRYSSSGRNVPSLVWNRRSKNQAFSKGTVSGV